MDRDTIILTRNYNKVHLGTVLDYYGPKITSRLFPNIYMFQSNRFGKARTRPDLHYCKNGRIKKKYIDSKKIKQYIQKDLENIERYDEIQKIFEKNLIKLQRNVREMFQRKEKAAIIIQKNTRKFIVRCSIEKAKEYINNGVNFIEDSITCEQINFPYIIKSDFEAKARQIYDYYTVQYFKKMVRIPYYVNEFEEIVYIERFFGTYLSPYTRKEFKVDNFEYVGNKLWYIFGRNISLKKMMC